MTILIKITKEDQQEIRGDNNQNTDASRDIKKNAACKRLVGFLPYIQTLVDWREGNGQFKIPQG